MPKTKSEVLVKECRTRISEVMHKELHETAISCGVYPSEIVRSGISRELAYRKYLLCKDNIPHDTLEQIRNHSTDTGMPISRIIAEAWRYFRRNRE